MGRFYAKGVGLGATGARAGTRLAGTRTRRAFGGKAFCFRCAARRAPCGRIGGARRPLSTDTTSIEGISVRDVGNPCATFARRRFAAFSLRHLWGMDQDAAWTRLFGQPVFVEHLIRLALPGLARWLDWTTLDEVPTRWAVADAPGDAGLRAIGGYSARTGDRAWRVGYGDDSGRSLLMPTEFQSDTDVDMDLRSRQYGLLGYQAVRKRQPDRDGSVRMVPVVIYSGGARWAVSYPAWAQPRANVTAKGEPWLQARAACVLLDADSCRARRFRSAEPRPRTAADERADEAGGHGGRAHRHGAMAARGAGSGPRGVGHPRVGGLVGGLRKTRADAATGGAGATELGAREERRNDGAGTNG